MRKYLLFTFVLLLSFFFLYQTPTVEAAVKGQACGLEIGTDGSLIADHGNCDNDPRFKCDKANPGDTLDPSQKCYEVKEVTCTCNPGNAAQTGKNGFSCAGGPSGFCNDNTQYCVPGDSDASTVRDARDVANSVMHNFKGVSCVVDNRVGPNERCEGKTCLNPGPDGKQYACQLVPQPIIAENPAIEYRCLPTDANNLTGCPKVNETCNLISSGGPSGCCATDADGVTKLTCDPVDNKCKPETAVQGACAKENEACGKTGTNFAITSCCQQTVGNQTLSCVDQNNVIIDSSATQGTCKLRDNSTPLPGTVEPTPTIPLPPPPPCNGALVNGTCPSFMTAFGEVATDPGGFLQRVFAILLAVSGGIALLLIIKAGYQLMVSAGNPEKVKAGREQLTAAIVGLLFIIFSFVILEVINVDILGIPGFG